MWRWNTNASSASGRRCRTTSDAFRKALTRVALIDMLQSFAAVGVMRRITRAPTMTVDGDLDIKGRAPPGGGIVRETELRQERHAHHGRREHHDTDGAEHGGQEHLHAAGGADRADGAHGLLCTRGQCDHLRRGQDIHARGRVGQFGVRPEHVHGGDERGGQHTQQRQRPRSLLILDEIRPRHQHAGRAVHRVVGGGIHQRPTSGPRRCSRRISMNCPNWRAWWKASATIPSP